VTCNVTDRRSLTGTAVRRCAHSGSPLCQGPRSRCLSGCASACRRQGRSSGGALHLDGSRAPARGAGCRGRVGVGAARSRPSSDTRLRNRSSRGG